MSDYRLLRTSGFIACLYLYRHWRSNYQEREGLYPINQLNFAILFCLSQTRTRTLTPYHVVFSEIEMREACLFSVDIGGIPKAIFGIHFTLTIYLIILYTALNAGVELDELNISILLYVDDVALIASDEQHLQNMLDCINSVGMKNDF